MDWAARIVVVAVALAIAWAILRPRPAFVVRVLDGQITVVRGPATAALMAEIREMCERHGVRRCHVRGVVRGSRIALVFSGEVPPAAQQQLRNWWANSGWSARPNRT